MPRSKHRASDIIQPPTGSILGAALFIFLLFGELCNGSTTGSEPVSLGSNPSSPTLVRFGVVVSAYVRAIHFTPDARQRASSFADR